MRSSVELSKKIQCFRSWCRVVRCVMLNQHHWHQVIEKNSSRTKRNSRAILGSPRTIGSVWSVRYYAKVSWVIAGIHTKFTENNGQLAAQLSLQLMFRSGYNKLPGKAAPRAIVCYCDYAPDKQARTPNSLDLVTTTDYNEQRSRPGEWNPDMAMGRDSPGSRCPEAASSNYP